jgi:hypothetical protein
MQRNTNFDAPMETIYTPAEVCPTVSRFARTVEIAVWDLPAITLGQGCGTNHALPHPRYVSSKVRTY